MPDAAPPAAPPDDPVDEDAIGEEAVRRAVEAAPDGIIVADDTGRIRFANPMACTIFGYAADGLLGEPVDVLLPEPLQEHHVQHRNAYVAHPRTRPMGSGLDLRGRRRDGAEFPVEISLSPVRTADHTFVVAIVRDITDRKRADEELVAANEQLALVSDRERIARDLHDTVIQRLFAVGLSLQAVLARTTDEHTATRLELAIEEIDATIRDVRTAIFGLHTRRGVETTLRESVLAMLRDAARGLGFEPQVYFDGPVDSVVTEALREQLLPTLREALTNIAKHAEASRATVTIEVDRDVVLRVVDNGRGIADADTAGRGLGNMTERARDLGGDCTFAAGESGGTVVEWRVPRA